MRPAPASHALCSACRQSSHCSNTNQYFRTKYISSDMPVQVVVLGQVLAADINIGYEEMVNTRVRAWCM